MMQRRGRMLDFYLLKQFFPIFFASLCMFAFLVILIDLFMYLVRYLSNGAKIAQILQISFYYLPKSLHYALPVALLFASAYTIGDLYIRNELTTILCSGVPFWRFCAPLIAVGLFASVLSFFFEDAVVIPALRIKNELNRRALYTQKQEKSSDIVIKTDRGKIIYQVDYFDGLAQAINGLTLITLDAEGNLVSLLRSQRAEWTGKSWKLASPYRYEFRDGFLRASSDDSYGELTESPETFRRSSIQSEELSARDAALHIKDLEDAGLPVVNAKTEYYHRFSFSAVSFVVIFISVTLGGRFSKNILLMTLLSSLGAAAVFYIIEMLTMMCAKFGIIPAPLGGWIPVFVCTASGVFMMRYAKT
jgi:lipopolysaccharide export system permease protein